MKHYILHIGLPKTGTTALQTHYFCKLDRSAVSYNPPALVRALIEALKLLDFGMLRSTDVQRLNDAIADQERQIEQKSILISLENLSQRLGRFDFVGRAKFLRDVFPEATVALVLRYQPALLRGLYLQFLHQLYILRPEEVFIPFAKREFSDAEQWKSRIQIDVREWSYAEAIRHFRRHYGERLQVLFYEDFPDLVALGKEIVAAGDCGTSDVPSFPLPRANVSFDPTTVERLHRLARWKLAFRANTGFESRHVRDLMEQAQQARFAFDAPDLITFADRLANPRHRSTTTYGWLDHQLFKIIRENGLGRRDSRSLRYELPEPIRSHLQQEARNLNASLAEAVPERRVPAIYL
jgi:hypothetical protein